MASNSAIYPSQAVASGYTVKPPWLTQLPLTMYITQQNHTLGGNDINIAPLLASVMQSGTNLFTSQCLRLEDIAMNNMNNMQINTQWKFTHPQKILLIIVNNVTFFHIQLWFPASGRDFWRFGSDFWSFCKVITEKKHCGKIKNWSWPPVWKGVHPREFVFHKNHSLSPVISGIQTHEGELLEMREPKNITI